MSKWYADGLRFSCTQCGNCCTGAPGYVWVAPRDQERIAAFLGLDLDAFRQRYARLVGTRIALVDQPNGDCIFLTPDRRCSIQPCKPRQCLTFPFWQRLTSTRQNWDAEGQSCPGLGNGPRYRPEEIDAIQDPGTPRELVCKIFANKRAES